MIDLAAIEAAARNVYAAMLPTPQYAWPKLRSRIGCNVWVKHENHTPVGAFKIRGALNMLMRLPSDALRRGVVIDHPASTRAFAYVMAGHAKHHMDIVRKRLGK